MASGFGSYEIARSGLIANERALYVTGHNISNVNTPGYVRQQAMMTEKIGPAVYGKGGGIYRLGLGADIQEIRQIRHAFLDNIYRQENMNLGYWESRNKALADIQAILGEPMDEGLQNAMNEFYDAWHELSKEPESLTVRALLVQKAENLVHQINHIGEQINRLQNNINTEISHRVDEVNNITRQIAELNLKIARYEITGDKANDYRDTRNSLIDRLTKLINVDVTEFQNGQVDITTGGYYLVQRDTSSRILAQPGGPGDMFYNLVLEDRGIRLPVSGGIIKGLLEARGEVSGKKGSLENGTPNVMAHVTYIIDVSDSGGIDLDEAKEKIINDVQELNRAGVDLNITLVTTSGNAVLSRETYGKEHYDNFIQDLGLVTQQADGSTEDFAAVFGELNNINFRDSENKYAVLFTNSTIDAAQSGSYSSILNDMGIKMNIVTGSGTGWESLVQASDGSIYPQDVAGGTIGTDIKTDVNKNISLVGETNNVIPDLKKQLNALINIMAREINSLHKKGKTMSVPPLDGQDFFVAINSNYPLEMGNIKLNDNLVDLNNIVASVEEYRGDNTIALEIANLKDKPLIEDSTGTLSISEYYRSIILKIGNYGAETERTLKNQYTLVNSADDQRQSIAGVSLDEEMANMLKYKYGYNAASKAISAIDQMIETIITRMGVAGR